ncbi:MAG: penicillin-binding protein 2 [Nitrospirae bacterium]|nr:penicillin-binding protein 2 [Nitrospirota bacterium]
MRNEEDFKKIIKIGYIVIAAFALIIIRLWQLQVLQGDEYLKLSEANRLRIINIHAPRGIIFDRNGIPLVRNTPFFSVSVIPNEFHSCNIESLSKLIKVSSEEIQKKLKAKEISPFTSVKLKEGLSFQEVAFIEARRSDFPGLIIEIEISREYLYADIGSHLIGYLGKISSEQTREPSFKNIPPDSFIGQWGIEKLYDETLRGKNGKRVIEIDALGNEIRLLQEIPPVKGKDISISIDINLQKEAEQAFGNRAGALVAILPNTGEILGLVSKPSFDPNLFVKGIDYNNWLTLIKDKKKPLINRALQSQYPPGSTFKIITAIAGLEEGVITPDTKINCKGGIQYGKWRFGCWQKRGHGVVSFHRALVESCDVYFYEVGQRLGIDKIYKYAISFGLGSKTGIELGIEREGLIPNTEWKLKEKNLPWFLGETFISAIGQGYVAATPIQMASLIGSVANEGNLYKPILLKDAKPILLRKITLKPETIKTLKRALMGVVNDNGGTGWAARSQIANISGKTGTAQVVAMRRGMRYAGEAFRDHAWFVAYAPDERPEIALAVLVEHGGHGGGAAAPIAKRAIEVYLKEKNNLNKN